MLHNHRASTKSRSAFTLTELIVVIALIVILIGILIPVIGKIQGSAKAASSGALISQLSTAIEAYYQDFHAYPGPLSNTQIYSKGGGAGVDPGTAYWDPTANAIGTWPNGGAAESTRITMAENLVLGLCGGLRLNPALLTQIAYDSSFVGKGPFQLNQYQPKQFHSYMEVADLTPSWRGATSNAHYSDESGAADDSAIPEFVDRFNNPMPILYMRARVGATQTATPPTAADNPVITNGTRTGQYDLAQVISYTGAFTGAYPALAAAAMTPTSGTGVSIGVGKDLPEYYDNSGTPVLKKSMSVPLYHGLRTVNPAALMTPPGAGYYLPYDCFPYFTNTSLTDPTSGVRTAKQKDRFILISAGKDRVYGTDDDITSFGTVAP